MNRIALPLVLTLAYLLQGCAIEPAPATSISQWQQGLERYVWEQGNGDPAVLRDATWDDVHPGFATLGDPLPDRSTDVYGLLLAHPTVSNHAYFVFLVTVVHNQVIEQMLPVALEIEAGNFHWTEGASDETQTRRYVEWHTTESQVSTSFHFPARDDAFDVYTEDNAVSISHEQSGAVWRVELPSTQGSTASPPTARPARRNGAAPDPPAPASPYPPPRPATAPADTSSTHPAGN